MIRIAVLASGGGSNLQALLDACAARRIPGRVVAVVCNVPEARALERARQAGAAAELLPSKGAPDRGAYDAALLERVRAHQPDLVCLAGWMRLVGPGFLSSFGTIAGSRGCPRVMNIHPGLLPAFPGLHAQGQALAHGARFAGATVHFVDEGTDTGPIIAQAVVPVLQGDDEEALARRILAQEHRLYPAAVRWFAEGRLSLSGRKVTVDGARPPGATAWVHPWDE